MSFNKFLETGQGLINLQDGSTVIVAKTLSAINLTSSTALRTDALSTIISSDLLISDTSGLQASLDSKLGSPLPVDLDVNKNNLLNTNILELCETGIGEDVIAVQAPASIDGDHNFILPSNTGGLDQVLTSDSFGATSWTNKAASGGGDVSSALNFSADNRITRTDTISGVKNVQQSTLTLSDQGDISSSSTLQILSTVDAINSLHLLANGGTSSSIHIESNNSTSGSAIFLESTGSGGARMSTENGQLSILSAGSSTDSILISNSNIGSGGINLNVSSESTGGIFMSIADSTGTALEVSAPEGGLKYTAKSILYNTPSIVVNHNSTEDDLDVIKINLNTNNFANIKAIHTVLTSGAIVSGDNLANILTTIDETLSTGDCSIFSHVITKTSSGTAEVHGMLAGIDVNPILQNSGDLQDADEILNNAVSVITELSQGGAGNITVFVANNDTLIVENFVIYSEIEIIIPTPASGNGVKCTFEISTAPATWIFFDPIDGTSQFRNSGTIKWQISDVPLWAAGTSGNFEIRITRTRTTLTTSPVLDLVQVGLNTNGVFSWDKTGDLNIRNLKLNGLDQLVLKETAPLGNNTISIKAPTPILASYAWELPAKRLLSHGRK